MKFTLSRGFLSQQHLTEWDGNCAEIDLRLCAFLLILLFLLYSKHLPLATHVWVLENKRQKKEEKLHYRRLHQQPFGATVHPIARGASWHRWALFLSKTLLGLELAIYREGNENAPKRFTGFVCKSLNAIPAIINTGADCQPCQDIFYFSNTQDLIRQYFQTVHRGNWQLLTRWYQCWVYVLAEFRSSWFTLRNRGRLFPWLKPMLVKRSDKEQKSQNRM